MSISAVITAYSKRLAKSQIFGKRLPTFQYFCLTYVRCPITCVLENRFIHCNKATIRNSTSFTMTQFSFFQGIYVTITTYLSDTHTYMHTYVYTHTHTHTYIHTYNASVHLCSQSPLLQRKSKISTVYITASQSRT